VLFLSALSDVTSYSRVFHAHLYAAIHLQENQKNVNQKKGKVMILLCPYASQRSELHFELLLMNVCVMVLSVILCLDSAEETKSVVTMNNYQLSGAIFLPLRMRSNLMPLLIVNTHLACNALDFFMTTCVFFALVSSNCGFNVFLLLSTGKFDHPTFQLAQASVLMNELIRLRYNQPKLPIVFCGDLNSTRQSLVREYILHGMPPKGEAEGLSLVAGAMQKFSQVWQDEFNKTFDKLAEVKVWTRDCFPWQQLWFDETNGSTLLPRNHDLPLADAFEDLHNDENAVTNPGERLVIDHMYAQAAPLGQFCFLVS
jgi:hypothetical protein